MKILNIAWKDAIIRFSDRAEFLFFLVLPVIFSLLLSGGIPQISTSAAIRLLVVDEDQSQLSRGLVDTLIKDGAVNPQLVSRAEASKQFADNEVPAWLAIPAGFEKALLNGAEGRLDLQKTPNNTNADAVQRAVSAAASSINRAISAARTSVAEAERLQPFASEQERQAYFSSSLEAAQSAFQSAPERLKVTQLADALVKANTYDPAAQASIGQVLTWIFIPLVGTCGLFAFERNWKTLQRLLTTPTRKATFLLGSIFGQLIIAVGQMVILIGFGALVLKVPWGRSPAGLVVMMLSFGLCAVALGTMLGTFVKTEKQASNLSIMIGMVMALLGGCWFPLELFPQAMRTVSKVLPLTWAMQGLTDLVVRGKGLVQILPAAGVLLGFALVFFVVGIRRFRYE